MAMKRCPVCGEKFSDTYKNCPFCEEEAYWDEEEPRRPAPRSGRKSAHGLQYNLITPTLIVLILIMALLLVYLLYGDKIAQRLGGDEPDLPGTVEPQEPTPGGPTATDPDTTDPDTSDGPDTSDPDTETDPNPNPNASDDPDTTDTPGTSGNGNGVMPEGPDTTNPPTSSNGASTSDTSYSVAAKLPDGLTLNKTDFTEKVSSAAVQLRVSGGNGSYTWISENPSIASVDSNGKVTMVSAGTTNVLVTDGSRKAICIVRVKGGSATSSGTTQKPAGSGSSSSSGSSGSGSATLNKTDFTRTVAEGSVQLKVSGVTSSITWSSSNTSVATVSGSGLVTPVGKGQATITASWNGQSLTCIVRVPG